MLKDETRSRKDQLRKQGETALKSGKPVTKCPPSKRHPPGKRARPGGYFKSINGKVT